MIKYIVCSLAIVASTLSGCSYTTAEKEPEEIPVRISYTDVTLTTVRDTYKDSSVEIYDLNQPPSVYVDTTQPIEPPVKYVLNKRIPVKDRSVEIYDLGFTPLSGGAAPLETAPQIPLAPPSQAKEGYRSPFQVIEDDGLLTDPSSGNNTETSVIVPMTESQDSSDDDFELMTGF